MADLNLVDIIKWADETHPSGREILEQCRGLNSKEQAKALVWLVSQLDKNPFICLDRQYMIVLMCISLVITETIDPETAEAADKIQQSIDEIFKDL